MGWVSPANALDILIVSQFFTPEMGAPAARFQDFGSMLAQRGHRVTVITGFPNSPSGIVPIGYRRRLFQRERIGDIDVLRGWIYASPRLGPLTKSLGFASFAASASLQSLVRRLRADVVIATSPPPTVGIPGLLAARRLRAPLVLDVRDIWPEAIAASGRVRSGPLIRTLEILERALYQRAAAVTVVTEGKRARLADKGVEPEKIHVVPNGVDLQRFEGTDATDPDLLGALGVDPDRFVVLYAGIMNPPQGLDILLDAAVRLRAQDPDVAKRLQVVLVGAGSERRRLEQRVREEGLGDLVRLCPEQPRDRIPGLLRAAGAVAVTLRPRRDTHTVPSKLYEAMASGRPVLVSADGAPAELLHEAGAGMATPAGDADALARSIRRLLDEPTKTRLLGAEGRRFAARYDRRRLVDALEGILEGVVARARHR
jgi:colanic acid biosynthesis glycosyl transferase WcaI